MLIQVTKRCSLSNSGEKVQDKPTKSIKSINAKSKSEQCQNNAMKLDYRCIHCNYSASLLSKLEKHIKAKHQKEKKARLKDPLQVSKDSDFKDIDVGTSSSRTAQDKLQMMNSSVMIKEEMVDSKEDVHVWAFSGIQ